MPTEQASPLADVKASVPAEGGQPEVAEAKKFRFCGRYHKRHLPVEKFSKECVLGCDECRELDKKYAQIAKARKRKAEQDKKKDRKKRRSERTMTETGECTPVGDVSTVESGDQNHVERGTCSNSHRKLVILDCGVL
jgi:sRNA-binding protein